MDNHERLHRPDLERSEPKRNSATYFRDPTAGVNDLGQSDDYGTAEDVVAYGVKLGYQVIEEQIREGQRLAQRLRPSSATAMDDISPLVGRVLHLYKDLGSLCLDAVETLARSPGTRLGLSRAGEAKQRDSYDTGIGPGAAYGIEVLSPFRTQVTLKLSEGARNVFPRAHALHASDPNIRPLTGVSFKISPETKIPTLLVEIADAQCPATYTGVVVDALTNEPCGTLCIRLST
jgi:hypothetical protein